MLDSIPLGASLLARRGCHWELPGGRTRSSARYLTRYVLVCKPPHAWKPSMIRSDRRRQCDAIRSQDETAARLSPACGGRRPEMMKQAFVARFSKAISIRRGQPRNSALPLACLAIFIATPSPEGFGIIPRDASSWSLHDCTGAFIPPSSKIWGLSPGSDLPLRRFCLSPFLWAPICSKV
jgi:hypothetical protein